MTSEHTVGDTSAVDGTPDTQSRQDAVSLSESRGRGDSGQQLEDVRQGKATKAVNEDFNLSEVEKSVCLDQGDEQDEETVPVFMSGEEIRSEVNLDMALDEVNFAANLVQDEDYLTGDEGVPVETEDEGDDGEGEGGGEGGARAGESDYATAYEEEEEEEDGDETTALTSYRSDCLKEPCFKNVMPTKPVPEAGKDTGVVLEATVDEAKRPHDLPPEDTATAMADDGPACAEAVCSEDEDEDVKDDDGDLQRPGDGAAKELTAFNSECPSRGAQLRQRTMAATEGEMPPAPASPAAAVATETLAEADAAPQIEAEADSPPETEAVADPQTELREVEDSDSGKGDSLSDTELADIEAEAEEAAAERRPPALELDVPDDADKVEPEVRLEAAPPGPTCDTPPEAPPGVAPTSAAPPEAETDAMGSSGRIEGYASECLPPVSSRPDQAILTGVDAGDVPDRLPEGGELRARGGEEVADVEPDMAPELSPEAAPGLEPEPASVFDLEVTPELKPEAAPENAPYKSDCLTVPRQGPGCEQAAQEDAPPQPAQPEAEEISAQPEVKVSPEAEEVPPALAGARTSPPASILKVSLPLIPDASPLQDAAETSEPTGRSEAGRPSSALSLPSAPEVASPPPLPPGADDDGEVSVAETPLPANTANNLTAEVAVGYRFAGQRSECLSGERGGARADEQGQALPCEDGDGAPEGAVGVVEGGEKPNEAEGAPGETEAGVNKPGIGGTTPAPPPPGAASAGTDAQRAHLRSECVRQPWLRGAPVDDAEHPVTRTDTPFPPLALVDAVESRVRSAPVSASLPEEPEREDSSSTSDTGGAAAADDRRRWAPTFCACEEDVASRTARAHMASTASSPPPRPGDIVRRCSNCGEEWASLLSGIDATARRRAVVSRAMEACERELGPLHEALRRLREKVRALDLPELSAPTIPPRSASQASTGLRALHFQTRSASAVPGRQDPAAAAAAATPCPYCGLQLVPEAALSPLARMYILLAQRRPDSEPPLPPLPPLPPEPPEDEEPELQPKDQL